MKAAPPRTALSWSTSKKTPFQSYLTIPKFFETGNEAASLDAVYHFNQQKNPRMKALIAHDPQNGREIGFGIGEILELEAVDYVWELQNRWNGFLFGKHAASGKKGLFPAFKVQLMVDWVPIYL